jgi:hypothetical protein
VTYVAVEEKCPDCTGGGLLYVLTDTPAYPLRGIGCNRCLGTGWLEVYRHVNEKTAPTPVEIPVAAHVAGTRS